MDALKARIIQLFDDSGSYFGSFDEAREFLLEQLRRARMILHGYRGQSEFTSNGFDRWQLRLDVFADQICLHSDRIKFDDPDSLGDADAYFNRLQQLVEGCETFDKFDWMYPNVITDFSTALERLDEYCETFDAVEATNWNTEGF